MARHRNYSGGSGKKTIFWLALLLGIIIVLAAILPYISSSINSYIRDEDYGSGDVNDITPVNITEPGGSYPEANPNYELNVTADRTYEINTCSEIDYKPTSTDEKTKFGESYKRDQSVAIIVTDTNGTPIPEIPLIVELYADNNPWPSATLGLVTGALIGAAIGYNFGPVGLGLGTLIGAVVGFCIGYYGAGGDKAEIQTGDTIICNQGEHNNEWISAEDWGGIAGTLGDYQVLHCYIGLTDSDLNSYADFAVTGTIQIDYNANIYIRLATNDKRLLEVQKEIQADSEYQGLRIVDEFSSYGHWDGDFPGYPASSDKVCALDTTNVTGVFYKPQISTHDNNFTKVRETRLIRFNDLTGVTNDGFYYVFYDYKGNIINPELYQGLGISFTNLDNESVGFNQIESGGYYNVVYEFILNPFKFNYTFQLLYFYEVSGTSYIESLGMTHSKYDHSGFVTSFFYTYSSFYSPDADIHRVIYDYNDKMPLVCDFNSPFFMNGSDPSHIKIKVRYFLGTSGYNLNGIYDADNTFSFAINLRIFDNSQSYVDYVSGELKIGYGAIGTAVFDLDLTGLDIKDMTSYCMEIYISSGEDTSPYSGARYPGMYSTCLFYLLRNYEEFMDDIKDLDALLASLKTKEDVGAGTYDTVNEILANMKPKIDRLSGSLNALESENAGVGTDILKAARDAITRFQDYYVWLQKFMGEHSAEDVSQSGALFFEFKERYLSEIGKWYADAFVNYNRYVFYLNGEYQISDDVHKIIQGSEARMEEEYQNNKNHPPGDWLPPLVTLLTIIIAAIVGIIAYYLVRSRTRDWRYAALIALVVFAVTALVAYFLLLSISDMVARWYYAVYCMRGWFFAA